MSKQIPLPLSLNVAATFENTYVSPSNRLLIHALQHFESSPRGSLVYCWGAKGSGVTHILEATLNHLTISSVQYLSLRDLQKFTPAEVLDSIECLDVVCVDDIDLIAGQQAWEQQLFYLCNGLRDSGKKLLIGSHCPPRQLPLKLADLKSRLQWGSVYRLETLNDDEKCQLLMLRAKNLGLVLTEEVATYLIHRVGRSIKELIALLKKLDHQSLAEQRRLTIPFVKAVLTQTL